MNNFQKIIFFFVALGSLVRQVGAYARVFWNLPPQGYIRRHPRALFQPLLKMDNHAIRVIIYYEFLRGSSTTMATENINTAFRSATVSQPTVHRWFQRFASGDISFEDRPHTGRPPTMQDQELLDALDKHPAASTRELARLIGHHQSTIADRLNSLGYRRVLARWIPHVLTAANKATRVSICQSLLLRPRRAQFLANVVTGDESWLRYHSDTRLAYWLPREEEPPAQPKPDPHGRKVLLCCFWDAQGMIFWELLSSKETVTSNVYSRQLRDLADALHEKRRRRAEVHLLHDNARPHTAYTTLQQLEQLGWATVPHPPYSPDLAPSDYHLFRSLKNCLAGKQFKDLDHLKTGVGEFFESLPAEFWSNGIYSLPERWAHVIDTQGDYIVD
jgi:[histone H3]-lysine36 N-dimethyltransferase SETMAR